MCYLLPSLGNGSVWSKPCRPVVGSELGTLVPVASTRAVLSAPHARCWGGPQHQESRTSSQSPFATASPQEALPSLCHSSGGCGEEQPQTYSQMLPAPRRVMLFFPGSQELPRSTGCSRCVGAGSQHPEEWRASHPLGHWANDVEILLNGFDEHVNCRIMFYRGNYSSSLAHSESSDNDFWGTPRGHLIN